MTSKRPVDVMQTSGSDPLDSALGAHIRVRRKRMGVSQTKLAESIGVTFQQIQKYERGANRVSFSALVRIAKALDCRVADLIEDVDGVAKAATACTPASVLLMQFGAADLLESYSKIQSKTVRQAIVDLSRKLSMSS